MGGCTSSSAAGGGGKGPVEFSTIEQVAGIKVVDHSTPFFKKYAFAGAANELLLGEGGFSKVLRGRRINNEKTEELAVKCIDMAKISKTEKQDLMREAIHLPPE